MTFLYKLNLLVAAWTPPLKFGLISTFRELAMIGNGRGCGWFGIVVALGPCDRGGNDWFGGMGNRTFGGCACCGNWPNGGPCCIIGCEFGAGIRGRSIPKIKWKLNESAFLTFDHAKFTLWRHPWIKHRWWLEWWPLHSLMWHTNIWWT